MASLDTLQDERILFSDKPDWQPWIEARLAGLSLKFADPRCVDLQGFSLIVPLTIEDALHLNERARLLPELPALVPSDRCIGICHDKLRFHQFLNSRGFTDAVPPLRRRGEYPYILKPREGAFGVGMRIVHSAEDELRWDGTRISPTHFRQACITGFTEYTCHFIRSEGRTLFFRCLQFNYAEDLFIKGSETKPLNSVEVDHVAHQPLFDAILSALEYQGIGCFNYKVIAGQPTIFEINPRFGGSLVRFLDSVLPIYRDAIRGRR
jgi:carbamoylphosphate synthase large subunit